MLPSKRVFEGFFTLTEEIFNGKLLSWWYICEIPKTQYFGLWFSKITEFKKKKGVISAIAL